MTRRRAQPEAQSATEPSPGRPGGLRRRDLFAGAGGLAVGAAGGALLGPARSATPVASGPSAAETLMTEHGVLKRVLLCYRATVDRLAAGQPVPAGAVLDAAQVITDYVESFHEGLEEAYVFPRVAPTQPDLVRTLLVQHDRGRHLTARVLLTAAGDLTAPGPRASLQADLAAFVRMYEPHEAFEDTVVYPELRRVTPEPTLAQLADWFADLEAKEYGDLALARVLERVGGVEQQLGIADLSAFTPAAPGN